MKPAWDLCWRISVLIELCYLLHKLFPHLFFRFLLFVSSSQILFVWYEERSKRNSHSKFSGKLQWEESTTIFLQDFFFFLLFKFIFYLGVIWLLPFSLHVDNHEKDDDDDDVDSCWIQKKQRNLLILLMMGLFLLRHVVYARDLSRFRTVCHGSPSE